MRTTAYVPARPRYGLLDIVGLLFRELLLMIVIFLVVFAIGAAAVMTLKRTYTSVASINVGIGQEYVYQSRVGPLGERSAPPTLGEVAQSEAAILTSREVKLRAVRALGVAAFQDPDKPATGSVAKQEGDAIKAIDDGLVVATAPLRAVIDLSFESNDAERSAAVLNAVIDAYQQRRREVFQDASAPFIQSQREAFEDELAQADDDYERFLTTNDIGDFASAKTSLAATYQTVLADRLTTEAQLNQATQRLRTLEAQQAETPSEVVLQQDLNITARDLILQARTEREQLLARYQPDAQPVLDIDARIAQLQAYVDNQNTVGPKEVRTGPNTVWIATESTRINAAADRDALAARLSVLNRQLDDIRQRQARLTALESRNTTLMSNRDVLTASIRDFQQRENQTQAENSLVAAGADSVRVIERAAVPSRGSSLKMPLMGLAFLFAGFTALCVGLLRVFSRRGFVTPASAGRTLQMPVLAVAPMKTA